ncbi:NAD(P)/FAD-dependent oxidoreductase [Dyella choica]|uniref:Oxidoreductase n=1 Tax=Dyella choica TaxID=1927959 RepID=A0A432M8D3_9GAMM|nr:FAD-dependent monooxygenase [Dyella choica]RUL78159.1 oxidoreductase [Dyella choica]
MGSQRYDVAIAGGGPAGAAAAIMLARSGLRVVVADARRKRETSRGHGFQVGEGLPPSARHLLRALNVHDQVLHDGHRASPGTIAFWGNPVAHCNDFIHQLHGPGLQLDRMRFDMSLREAARSAGATLFESTRVQVDDATSRHTSHAPYSLQLCTNGSRTRSIEADWVLDASGRAASLARALGSSRVRHDCLIALYQRLRSNQHSDQDGRTWIEAVEDGWWYSVLLPSGERLIAFLCDADGGPDPSLKEPTSFWNSLKRASNLHALCVQHQYVPVGRPRGADASSSSLDVAAGPGWLAVGDAALAFDPLSSKGISNALYTGLQAAHTIIAANLGDRGAVERYAAHLHGIHEAYRLHLSQFYAMETRWPQATFWRRRR